MSQRSTDSARPLRRCVPALLLLLACGDSPRSGSTAAWTPPGPDSDLHPVTIARPASAGKLRTGAQELDGSPALISCRTCHEAGRNEALARSAAADGPRFHATVELAHAELQCQSCHTPNEPHLLRLADGEHLPIARSMELCSQCHGLIREAYDHGAHGGMRGYWDLQRGPRTRNDCITCHSPHRPAYPQVRPMPGPRDRFQAHPPHSGSLIEERFEGAAHE